MKKLLAVATLLILTTAPTYAAGAWQIDTLSAGTTDSALIAADAANSRTQRVFCGFSAIETSGANPATVRVYNGSSADDDELLFAFSLANSESRSEGPWPADECLPCPDGVFIDRGGTGTPQVVIYTRQR